MSSAGLGSDKMIKTINSNDKLQFTWTNRPST